MKKDFEYIASRFENENIAVPDNLSDKKIKEKLEQGAEPNNIIKLAGRKNNAFSAAVSLVACFAIVIVSITAFNAFGYRSADKSGNEYMVPFQSYAEINSYINNLSYFTQAYYCHLILPSVKTESDCYNLSNATELENMSSINDDKYLYYVDIDGYIKICTYDMVQISEIKADRDSCYDGIVLYKDYIIGCSADDKDRVLCDIFDISNPENPQLAGSFMQSGELIAVKQLGEYAYIVSSYSPLDKPVPYATDINNNYSKLSIDDICRFKNPKVSNYAVVTSINIETGEHNTKAFLGFDGYVCFADDRLYLTDTAIFDAKDITGNTLSSQILKIGLDGINFSFDAVSRVDGYVADMCEYNGFLQIVSISVMDNERNNRLYVLDSELNTVDMLAGFADNCTIYGTYFINDLLFISTLETKNYSASAADESYTASVKVKETDSVIDMSNPENITERKNIDVSVLNNYYDFIYIDENTFLAFDCYDEYNFALIRINKDKSVSVIDSVYFSDYDYENLFIDYSSGAYALAYSVHEYYDSENAIHYSNMEHGSGLITFNIENDKISVLEDNKLKNPAQFYKKDSKVYAYDNENNLFSYDLK